VGGRERERESKMDFLCFPDINNVKTLIDRE